MTASLLVIAAFAALNPLRVAPTAPAEPQVRRSAAVIAAVITAAGVTVTATLSGPLLDALSVTGSSSRIAAGVAIVLVSLRDLLVAPLSPNPSLPGALAGLVPIAFPAMLTPALVLLSVAAAHERGVWVALAALAPSIVVAAATISIGRPGPDWARPLLAVGAGGIGLLVVLDGVYAI